MVCGSIPCIHTGAENLQVEISTGRFAGLGFWCLGFQGLAIWGNLIVN